MRNLIILSAVWFILAPLTGLGQTDKKLMSATLNVELSPGSIIDKRPELVKKSNALLDSFAAVKGYKLTGNVEIFHTNYDSLKAKLNYQKFSITREGTTDFYKVTKGNNQFLAFISPNSTAYSPGYNAMPALSLSIVLSYFKQTSYYAILTTISIKRIY